MRVPPLRNVQAWNQSGMVISPFIWPDPDQIAPAASPR
jgi:hypothetical protein